MLFCSCVSDSYDRVEQDLIGGTPVDEDDFSGVVQIFTTYTGGVCSAFFISPRILVSAAHCVYSEEEDVPVPVDTVFFLGETEDVPIVEIRPELSRGYKWASSGKDFVLLILENPVGNREIYELNFDSSYIQRGNFLTLVGFGFTSRERPFLPRKTYEETFISSKFREDFIVDEIPTLCFGDSGSPAFDLDRRVVGVGSRVGGFCDIGIYTSVYSNRELIIDSLYDIEPERAEMYRYLSENSSGGCNISLLKKSSWYSLLFWFVLLFGLVRTRKVSV